MKTLFRFGLVFGLSFGLLCGSPASAASPPAGDTVKLVTQYGYLPQNPVLVRVEVLNPAGERDRDLWDAEATLSADGGVSLSTNKIALRNGLGSALVTFGGGGDFTLTATVGSLSTNRALKTLAGVPVTTIGGTLPGASTTWSNVVNVTNALTVPAGHTLTILSNTLVLLNGVASGSGGPGLTVLGKVQSLGTEEQPVTFTCATSNLNWGEIRHTNATLGASQLSTYRHTLFTKACRSPSAGHTGTGPVFRLFNSSNVFEHCVVSDHVGKTMQASGSDLAFTNCQLARCIMGPEIEGSALQLQNTWVTEMFGTPAAPEGTNDNDGIYLWGQQGGQIITLNGCVFAGGHDDAIDTFGSTITVTNSIIRDWPNSNEDAKGISGFDGTINVRRCLVANCYVGIATKANSGATARVNISDSTITGVTRGLSAAVKANAPGPSIDFRVTNSIVRSADAIHTDFGPTNFTIGYSALSETWPGTGNTAANPLFVNEAAYDFHLRPGSPAINSGDPAAPFDADGSRADMGFFPWMPATNVFIAFSNAWRYQDDGSNQGTNWTAAAFNDAAWSNGVAQLGYSSSPLENDETTLIRTTGTNGQRTTTYYFRRAFTVTDAISHTNLHLRLLRDDGGVVHLNGVEIFRSTNMPGGVVAFDTLAVSVGENSLDATNMNAALPLLVNGTNVLAVEIHQQLPTSSDVSFDLELTGITGPSGNSPPVIALTSPTNNAIFTEPATITLDATASDADGSVAKVEFFQNGAKLGEDASAPYSLVWSNAPAGIYSLTAVATDDQGGMTTSTAVNVTVNPVNAPTTNALVALGSVWKYLDDGSDQGTNWTLASFDAGSWSNGVAQLGYGDGDETTVVSYGPNPNAKYPTTYFRRFFTVDDPAQVQSLALNLLRDDGAVAYINGQEVFRVSMPATFDYLSYATAATDYPFDNAALSTGALVAGTNVIAVEIHQGNAGSSDISFELELLAVVIPPSNQRPLVSLTAPPNPTTYAAPANVTLTALASDSDGTVTNVAFHANGAKLADDTNSPYSFAWNSVAAGDYALTAVATDATGLAATSSVVNLTVSTNVAPPVVANKSPAPGNVTNLAQIAVTFSKAVAGVNAGDLLVNGSTATGVSGSGSNYTFTFAQPAYGTVDITWAAAHGVADVFTPPHPFDTNSAGANWQYQFLDVVPPFVTAVTPTPNSTVAALTNIAITFSEPVTGVNAADLLINFIAAAGVSGSGAGPYTFAFAQPPDGSVPVAWAGGHGIQDSAANAFAGGAWGYTLDTNATGVVISEIMYHPASENVLEEWIELYNKGAAAVDLTGWRFTGGVQFTFTNVSIAAGGYLVVAADLTTFTNKFPGLTDVVGNWTGFLNNSSEDIDLDDAAGRRADSVRYADEGDWAVRQRGALELGHRGWTWFKEHDGLGKSLELVNPDLSNNHGQNWAASRATNGTPGAVNSVATNNVAPLILEAAHSPIVPTSADPPLIAARILDESPGGLPVTLSWRASIASPPPFTTVTMHDDGINGDAAASDGLYSALLSAQPHGTVVEFYIRATDAQGNARTWPAPAIAAADGAGPTGQVANALFQVDNTVYNPTNNQPLYKLIMTEAERAELQAIPSQSSQQGPNSQMNGTFICMDGAGTARHYLAGFRNRGHGSRTTTPPNYRVNFRSDDPWKGVSAINLNTVNVPIQHLGSVLARKAGAAGANTIPVQVRVNNENRAVGSYAANEVLDGDWAANHFPFNGDGNVYRAVRDIAPPDFSYRDESAASYTNTWFKSSNLSEDDWTDLIGMLRVVGVNNATSFTTENVRQVVNVEQWLRHLAVMNLFGNAESGLNSGYNDDYYMYRGVNDPRFILSYYDLDQILGQGSFGSTVGIFTATANNGAGLALDRFLHWPDFEPIYLRTLLELLNTTFAQANFNALVDQTLGDYVASGTIASIKSWMDQRRSYLLTSVLTNVPPATNAPTATIAGVPRSPTPLTGATLAVGGTDVVSYRRQLDGGGYGAETAVATPISLAGLANGTHTVSVIGKSAAGVWQAESNATVRVWVVNTAWPAVRLNEVLARNDSAVNHAGTFPDLIELFNEGAGTVDLSGLRLSDDAGNPNKFTFANGVTLAAGSNLVVYANNPDATPGIHVGFSLNQDGEAVYLFDRATNGSTVLDSVAFGLQLADRSIGRVAGGDWVLATPTLGAANVAAALGNERNLKINEWLAVGVSPNPDDFIELFNPDALPVALGGMHLTDQPIGAPALHAITPLSFIAGGGFVRFIADGDAGQGADHANFRLALEQGEIGLTAADRSVIDCVTYGPQQTGVSFGRCPDGAVTQKSLLTPTPGAPNACPVTPPAPLAVYFTTISNVWRYDQTGTNLGSAWIAPGYDDSAWPSGPALLGFDGAVLPEPFRTTFTLSNIKTTFYFRATFNVPSNLNVSVLQLRHIIDDGAVVYINGNEVHRTNMPAGNITASTLASGGVGDATYQGPFGVALTNLVPGTNVIAAEVHQSAATSGDLAFGLELAGIIVTNTPALAGVAINEVLANNATLEEADGSKPDWVEIYNPSSNAVDLADMSLTDSTLTPRRWVFPAGSLVTAQSFLKVRLDAELPSSATNTGFGLKANGGAVYLFNRLADGGSVASSSIYGIQAADWSLGRVPNGGSNWVLTIPTLGGANITASLGDPLQLKVNEWMASPSSGADWFEIFNPNAQPVSLAGLWLSDNLNTRQKYQIPALSFIGTGPYGYQRFWAANGADADFTSFGLAAANEAVVISTANGTLINGYGNYSAQQSGVSEGRLPDGTANIVRFPTTPTPEKGNFLPLDSVVVNELLSHSDPPLEDAVELFNPTGDDVDISGWYLSDSQNDLFKYRVPSNTVINAGGFVVFYENQFNFDNPGVPFSFNSAKGDEVYLSQSLTPGVLTGYRAYAEFGPQENGVSFGRYQTSVGVDFTAMSARTFGVDNPASTNQFRQGAGKTNAYPKVGPVVLNEFMYNQAGTNEALEFVELHNILGTPVTLHDPANSANTWRLRKGVDFNFPPATTIPAGGFLVIVNFDPLTDAAALAAFRAAYGTNMTLLGPYSGKLDNGGEAVELQKPDAPQADGSVPYVVADRVVYDDNPPWPLTPDGLGDALKRLNASLYGNDPVNWTGGPPTPGAANFAAASNAPPVLAAIGNTNIAEGALLAFTAMATDADVPAQSLTFSLDAGTPGGASITAGGAFTWAPDETQGPGVYSVTVRVTDNGSPVRSDFETISITVNEVNSPPALNPIGNKVANERTLVTFTAVAVDTDDPAQTLTYTLDAGAPALASLHPTSGVFTWIPGEADGPGVYTVTVRVTDNGSPVADDFETITITVNEVNDPPALSTLADQTIAEDTATGALAITIGDVETAAASLTLTGSSTNTALVPNANVLFGGSASNRTVTVTPAPNQHGTALITVTVSDGTNNTSDTFLVTVTPVNDAPVLSNITDQTIAEDTATGALALTIGDVETPAGSLTLTGSSTNTTLVPNANVVFGGSASNRTVTVTPTPNQHGTTLITVTVSDGTNTTTDAFLLTVNPVNDPPVISTIADQTISEDTATAALAFTVSDVETPAASLTLSATSTNTALVPSANVVFGGSASNRTVTVTPAANQSGTTLITVTVSDGTNNASDTFLVTVTPVNDAPVLSNIADQTLAEDTATGALAITIGDVETAAASLTLTGSSTNTALVPNANVLFGGSASNRTVTVTPAANQFGTTLITVTVSDGTNNTSDTFLLTVTPVNDPPALSNIADQTINEDTATAALAFTVGDVETPAASLTLSATSTNTALVPNANVLFGGSASNRTVTVTPAANQSGTTLITVTVSDGTNNAGDTFLVTVTPVNDPPALSNIADQTINEDTATAALAFTVGDVETPAASLTLSATSTNTALVPNANVLFGGSASNRTVTVTPAANQSGTTLITVTVSDGTNNAGDTFLVTVTPLNDPPVLSTLADQTIAEDTATGALALTIGDVETPAASLTLTGSSTNTALVPNANVVFGGSASNRTVTVTPAANQSGTTLITVTVSDGTNNASDTFLVTVTPVNDAPGLSNIADQTNAEDTATGALAITIGDVETPAASLTLSATSTNTALVPSANVVFGGSASNRTVTVTPAANQSGTTLITVTVSDGTNNVSDTFLLTVTPVNDPPVLSTIADQTINELTTLTLTNVASDPDGPAQTLTFALVSAPGGVNLDATSGVLTWMPTEAQGPTTNVIIVRVFDNGSPSENATQSFTVIVNEVNTAPTLAPIDNQAVGAGRPLTFTAMATDPDLPLQGLTYSLDAGAPAGAAINPTNGMFAWTAPDSSSTTTNEITVRVMDDGSPALSHTRAFSVVAVAAPRILSIALAPADMVALVWESHPGMTYRVRYSTDLAPNNWTDIGADVPATGPTASTTVEMGSDRQRFYRVMLVD